MNPKRQILIFLTFFILLAPSVKSQVKLGVIVILEDSLMTHSYTGLTFMDNYKNEYSLPFDLSGYTCSIVDSVLNINSKGLELVWLPESVFREYLDQKEKLKGKKFKNFRSIWYTENLQKYDVDGLFVITTTDLVINHGANGGRVVTESVCMTTEYGRDKSGLYIRLMSYMFWHPKPKENKSETYGLISDNIPMVIEGEQLTEDRMCEFEEPLKVLLRNEILYLRNNQYYGHMITELKRRESLKDYSENNK